MTIREVIRNLPEIKAGEAHELDFIHKSASLTPINIQRIKQSKPNGTWHDWDKQLLPDCYKKSSGQTYKNVYGRMSWIRFLQQ